MITIKLNKDEINQLYFIATRFSAYVWCRYNLIKKLKSFYPSEVFYDGMSCPTVNDLDNQVSERL